ncbi:type II toxin-antitoxin system RelE/ParE family toxin [Amycolatopsis pigmentata]|uniref:Type II toxin-antitoxin system RelE/ParE family toxin n=1 Tax=Amycolatopsis pigmentata TaxID=450801 RepID=A0ABW5FRM7_9PSEU
MRWEAELHDAVESRYLDLCVSDPETADLVEEAIDTLERLGPTLSRPLADRIKGSGIHNLKELRPESTGRSEIGMLFVFDPRRSAIVLVAGDKAGQWQRWYEDAIPLAEQRYKEHLAALEVDNDG